MFPLITLEEHFFAEGVEDVASSHYPAGVVSRLHDLGPLRLQSMDESGVSIQVISHGPSELQAAQCRAANDQLVSAIREHPDRFAGFAVLPMSDQAECVKELERCIRELGFIGALIDNRAGNTYFDGPEYDAFWAMAQDLDVPIYLHPTWPSSEQKEFLYTGNFAEISGMVLSSFGWGWHSDIALHVLRLFAAGTFDKYPRLKIIIGHMGEMIPFMLSRIDQMPLQLFGERNRRFREVYDTNMWITTSGVWSIDPMATVLRNTKIERILFSVDYPFTSNERGLAFLEELKASQMVTDEQLEQISYKNAEQLLGIRAGQTQKQT
jgi:predicted TIM-barrel fold metal-dependent hydrolase